MAHALYRRRKWIGMMIIILLSSVLICSGFQEKKVNSGATQAIRPQELHPLLSEAPLRARFNMNYPMDNIPYGSEHAFQNNAWQSFISQYGTGWRVMWDARQGRPNLIEGKGIPFYAGKGNSFKKDFEQLTIEYLHNKILVFAKANNDLLKLDFSKLRLSQDGSHIFENGRYCVIQYDYFIGEGIPVDGGRAYFRFNNGNLIQFGTFGISDVTIPTTPYLSAVQAENNVIEVFGQGGIKVSIETSRLLVIQEIPAGQDTSAPFTGKEGYGINYRLVWSVRYRTSPGNNWIEAWVDAQSGKIVQTYDLTRYGNVHGEISIRQGNRVEKTFPYCYVDNNGTNITNMQGYYLYTNSPSTSANTGMDGPYFNMSDHCGSIDLTTWASPGNLNFGASAGTDCDTPPGGSGGPGNTTAARSVFWHANMIRYKAKQYIPGLSWLDSQVTARPNSTDGHCNAYYDGTINFYQSSSGCGNTGEITEVVDHEWGHGLNAHDGGPGYSPDGDMASEEAYGDFLGILMARNGCIGMGFYSGGNCYNCPGWCTGVRYLAMRFDDDGNPGTPDAPVRPINITNDNGPDCNRYGGTCDICPYSTPDDFWGCWWKHEYRGIIGYEGHCESYIQGGALWDMADEISTSRGEKGWTWVDRIWFESLPSMGSAFRIVSGGECNTSANIDGCGGANWYTVLLGVDDDDGNITNGTPNAGYIYTGFHNHNIACGSAHATYTVCTPPSKPTLYAAPSDGQIGFTWTQSPDATGYVLYLNEYGSSTDCSSGGWVPLANFSAEDNTTTLFSMYNDIGHGYAIQAFNGSLDCVSNLSDCVWTQPTYTPDVNLTGYRVTGWDAPVVPSDNTCTTTTCTRSATLSANTASTKFNFKVLNNSSENAAHHYDDVYLDDVSILHVDRASQNANTTYTDVNNAAIVKGGRHVLKLKIDSTYLLTESLEDDNEYIIPSVIYEPYNLTTDTDHLITRTAPPDRDPEGYVGYSCDGYRFDVTTAGGVGYWGAVAMIPSTATANYDLRLHDDYTGSTQGYYNNVEWSTSGGTGQVEIIGINRNMTSTATWWASVVQSTSAPMSDSYTIHFDLSGGAINVPSSGNSGSIPANNIVSIEEITVGAEDLSTVWRFSVVPTGGDIAIALIYYSLDHFELADAMHITNNSGANGTEFFDMQFTYAGNYAILIYKPDSTQIANSITYSLSITDASQNLRPYTHTGWTHAVVARDTTGCTLASCAVTTTLPGWSGTTYVNSTTTNDGPNDVDQSFRIRYMLDDVQLEERTYASLAVGGTALDTNNSLTSAITGGRHTLGIIVDPYGVITESNETDNTFYTQYVWAPRVLVTDTPSTATAPPDRNTTGATYYNCHGYEFDVTPASNQHYWGAVGILPAASTPNYDLRLFDDYTGSIDGFRIPVVSSTVGSIGDVEVVGANRNVAANATWWAGVIQGGSTPYTGSYYIHKDLSGLAGAVPSTGTTGTIPVNGVVAVEEFEFDASDINIPWTVVVTPTGGDIGIAMIDQADETFSLGTAITGTRVNANGSNSAELFSFTPTVAGFYGLLIFKPDYSQLGLAIDYTITIAMTPSNLHSYANPGWSAPAVPRDSAGCTTTSCTLSTTLPGWTTSTFVNATGYNDGPSTVGVQLIFRYTIDDLTFKDTFHNPPHPASTVIYDMNNQGGIIKGGRHVLGLWVDADNRYSEANEADNYHYAQYVWAPRLLSTDVAFSASAPPDRDTTGYSAYNCDGYEFTVIPSGGQSYWGAMALLPTTNTANYDLRLHTDYADSTHGFSTVLKTSSSSAAGGVEIVGVNRFSTGTSTWYAGVIQSSGTPAASTYAVHKTASGVTVNIPTTGTAGTIPANSIIAIVDINVKFDDTGLPWRFTVTPAGGDIAVALIDYSLGYFRLADAIAGTWVNDAGANLPETFTFTPTSSGSYGLLIFKPDYSQLANSISWVLTVSLNGVAETPDGHFVPGVPFTIQKAGSASLYLQWGNSCDYISGVTRYAIYQGKISSLSSGTYDHKPLICDSGFDTKETIPSSTGSYYYLIVPTNDVNEGGYGFTSSGSARPVSDGACLPQLRISCP